MFAERVKESFKRAGKNWSVLIVSLLLAVIMWITLIFSEDYSYDLSYNLTIETAIPGRAMNASAKSALSIKGTASGYYLLQKTYTGTYDNLSISVNPRWLVHKGGDEFALPGPAIKQLVQEALGERVAIEWIASDTLYFDIPQESNRKVPVVALASLEFKSQYMQVGPLKLTPDSVLVYGPVELLENIDSIHTLPLNLKEIESAQQGILSLSHISNVTISPNEVSYSFDVCRYVEKRIQLPVGVANLPGSLMVAVIPQRVELRYRVPIPGNALFSPADFKAEVDLSNFDALEHNVARVVLSRAPKEVVWYEFNHKFVEVIYK